MDRRRRGLVAAGGTVGLFVLVQVGALALVQPFADAGFRPPSDPGNPANSLLYFGAILVATGVMLAAVKFGVAFLIKALVLLTSTVLNWIVLTVLIERFVPPLLPGVLPVVDGSAVAGVIALAIGVALYVYPEWYVIDLAGVVMGAGAAGLFGITFGVLPAIVLLTVLAVYDAISVYGTEHMLTLADNAMDMRIPVLFVVPTTLQYSFLEASAARKTDIEDGVTDGDADDGDPDRMVANGQGSRDSAAATDAAAGRTDDPGDDSQAELLVRDALFIGLGDAVMPTILAVSAAFFLDAPHFDLPILLNLPAVTALVGTMAGLLVLQWLVLRGRPHAGLPLLNGGAIAGYLVGAVLAGIPVVEALGLTPYV